MHAGVKRAAIAPSFELVETSGCAAAASAAVADQQNSSPSACVVQRDHAELIASARAGPRARHKEGEGKCRGRPAPRSHTPQK